MNVNDNFTLTIMGVGGIGGLLAGPLVRKYGDRISLVARGARAEALREFGMEAKRLRLVEPRVGAAASLVMVEGRRGGHSGLNVEPPLALTGGDGKPSDEMEKIYFRR